MQICQDQAESTGKQIDKAAKDRPRSCRVQCSYTDGTRENLNSPDGQPCEDMVGVGPTGACRDGSCPVGFG